MNSHQDTGLMPMGESHYLSFGLGKPNDTPLCDGNVQGKII